MQNSNSKFQTLAKVGWAAKGALYVTLGALAVMAAVGEGGSLLGSKGVLQWLAGQAFGRILLITAGIGFSAYSLWRFAQAITDPEQHKDTKSMVAKRLGWTASGVMHASLAVAAFQMFAGQGSGEGKQIWISKMMAAGSWGVVLVGALGLIAIGVGLYQFKRAAELGFMKDLNANEMSSGERKAIKIVGRVGHSARGVVFPIIGYFLLMAAFNHNASQAKGVGGALSELGQTSWIALAVIAAGLAAYGVLNLFYARYRRATVNL